MVLARRAEARRRSDGGQEVKGYWPIPRPRVRRCRAFFESPSKTGYAALIRATPGLIYYSSDDPKFGAVPEPRFTAGG